MKLLSAFILSFGLSVSVWAENENVMEVLSLAKWTGACGILTQHFQFQTSTQMDGGNDFLLRFWQTESTRLGMTFEEYAQYCVQVTDEYNAIVAVAEK